MNTQIKGKVLLLGDNIDTDQIYPGRYLELVESSDVGKHCLEGVSADIAPNFERGGIVVAGRNFGCGSSREHAPIALLAMGASLIIADSFARIFFRNAINLGLPLLVCKGINQQLAADSELSVDLLSGRMEAADGTLFQAEAIGEYALSILQAGGIKPLFRARKDNR